MCHRHPGTWSNDYQWDPSIGKVVTCSFGVDGSDILPITRQTVIIIIMNIYALYLHTYVRFEDLITEK